MDDNLDKLLHAAGMCLITFGSFFCFVCALCKYGYRVQRVRFTQVDNSVRANSYPGSRLSRINQMFCRMHTRQPGIDEDYNVDSGNCVPGATVHADGSSCVHTSSPLTMNSTPPASVLPTYSSTVANTTVLSRIQSTELPNRSWYDISDSPRRNNASRQSWYEMAPRPHLPSYTSPQISTSWIDVAFTRAYLNNQHLRRDIYVCQIATENHEPLMDQDSSTAQHINSGSEQLDENYLDRIEYEGPPPAYSAVVNDDSNDELPPPSYDSVVNCESMV